MEMLQVIIATAAEVKLPIILQVTESTINYIGLDYIIAMVSAAVKDIDIPIALHLDHGKDSHICKRCIDAGFSSVMIDKSSARFTENVTCTKEVVELAKKAGVSVEGELGTLTGREDDVSISGAAELFTDPDQAYRYIESTKVDSLAIAIGSSHGPFKGQNAPPKLDLNRLREIKCLVGPFYPLVLHGASAVYPDLLDICNRYGADIHGACGLKDEDVKASIKFGINKVNVDTDIRVAFMAGIRRSLNENPNSLDVRKHFGLAKEMMRDVVIKKIKLITNTANGGSLD
jgi:fructose-bisphosphate aldolase class II